MMINFTVVVKSKLKTSTYFTRISVEVFKFMVVLYFLLLFYGC